MHLALGTIISVILLMLALRGVRWPEVGMALAGMDYPLLGLALGTVLATTVAKAARWQLLFCWSSSLPRLGNLFSTLVIGQTLNAALPARLGEFARAYLIGEREGTDKMIAFGTVLVEKALDSLMLLLLLAILLPFMPLPPWLGRSGVILSLGLVLILFLLFLAARRSGLSQSWLSQVSAIIPGAERLDLPRRIEAAKVGLSMISEVKVGFLLLGWSAAIWLVAALTNYLTFMALGIEGSFLAALFLLVALQLGLAIPSAPGRVGVFQYICILTLSLFSVDQSQALSYSVVLHFIVLGPMVAMGIWCLFQESGRLNKLWSWHPLQKP